MNKKDRAKRDIEMAFDFARYLIDHPEEMNKLPDGVEVTFHEKSDNQGIKPSKNRKQVRVNVTRGFDIKKVA